MDVFCSSAAHRYGESRALCLGSHCWWHQAMIPSFSDTDRVCPAIRIDTRAYSSRWIQTALGYTLFWLSTLISIIDIDCGNEANEVLSSPSSLTQLWRIKAELFKNGSLSLCCILPSLCISPLVVAAVLGLWVSQHGAGAIAVITMKLDEI